jgi:flagellin
MALGDFNGDGRQDVVTTDGGSTVRVSLNNGTGSFGPSVSFATGGGGFNFAVTTGDFNGDGVADLAALDFGGGGAAILLGETTTSTTLSFDFSLLTINDAREAIPLMGEKLAHLTSSRGKIGAYASRLATASNVLQATAENYASASSKITDVDVAEESSRLAATQILQQSASSILAQANQQPTLALSLLRNI